MHTLEGPGSQKNTFYVLSSSAKRESRGKERGRVVPRCSSVDALRERCGQCFWKFRFFLSLPTSGVIFWVLK